MAVDTASKRRSASSAAFLPTAPGVTPDATKPAAWRRQAAWGYGSGTAQPDGPVCGTLTVESVIAGTLTIEGCGSVGNILYINEDMRVKMTGLSYETDLGATAYLNAATITYTLKDALGATVLGGTGSLDYVATTNGNYVTVIDKAVTVLLTEGARYYLHVPIAEGNRDGYRRLALRAEYHAA